MCKYFNWNKIKFEASIALLNEDCYIGCCDGKFIHIYSKRNKFIIPTDVYIFPEYRLNVNVDNIRTYLNKAIQFYKYCIDNKVVHQVNKGFYIIQKYLEEQKMNYVDNVLMALPNCDFYQSQMYDSNIFIYVVPKFLFVFFGKN